MNPNLSGLQFKHEYAYDIDHHVISATVPHEEEPIGTLSWIGHDFAEHHDVTPGLIKHVHVDEPYRRKGIASKMLNMAENVAENSYGEIPSPLHNGRVSDDAKAWIKGMEKKS